jgi:hypothetical protein
MILSGTSNMGDEIAGIADAKYVNPLRKIALVK